MMNLNELTMVAREEGTVRVEVIFVDKYGFNSSTTLTMDSFMLNTLDVSCGAMVKEVEYDVFCKRINNYDLYNVYFDVCDRSKVEWALARKERQQRMRTRVRRSR